MKKSLLTTITCIILMLPVIAIAQFDFDRVDYLSVDSIIYYQNPLVLKYDTIQEEKTMPVWFPAHCAEQNPFFFHDYLKEAPAYLHNRLQITDSILKRKIDVYNQYSLKEIKPTPYEYVFAELWLTSKETNEKVIIVISNSILNYIPNMDYNKLDTSLLGKLPDYFNSDQNPFQEIYSGWTSTSCYIYEDSLWKLADQMYVIKELVNKNGKIYYGGIKSFKYFIERADSYTRGRIVNGRRIFETVKNTPNGPVVVGGNGGKAWYQRYWWAIAGSLAALALLAYVILGRKKK